MTSEASSSENAFAQRERHRKPPRGADAQNFIPLRKYDLRRVIAADPIFQPAQRETFENLSRLLEAVLHHEYHGRLETLKDSYHPFDPDVDTARREKLTPAEEKRLSKEFFEAFIDLLDRANFNHLTYDDLTHALEESGVTGFNLEVDFNVFDRLEIFARGEGIAKKKRPSPWPWGRDAEHETPSFPRLVILFRLRENKRLPRPIDTRTIFIKIFKDIPKHDLDMLLPGTRVRMTWLDQSKIIIPTLSGVAVTLFKLIQSALAVAFASVFGLLGFLGLIGGTIGYGVKSFYAYSNTKDRYQLTLTRSLYYQNLDSNAGVFHRLLDEAEEQEYREAMIAYFLLWKNAGAEGWSVERLDAAAEQFILETTGRQIDFEIGDALEKLSAMKLAVPAQQGRWRAVELEAALAELDAAWDALFRTRSEASAPKTPHFLRPSDPEPEPEADDWGPIL